MFKALEPLKDFIQRGMEGADHKAPTEHIMDGPLTDYINNAIKDATIKNIDIVSIAIKDALVRAVKECIVYSFDICTVVCIVSASYFIIRVMISGSNEAREKHLNFSFISLMGVMIFRILTAFTGRGL